MESLSRLQLYQNMINYALDYEAHRRILEVNIDVLRDIEPLFLTQDNQPESKIDKDPRIVGYLINNINRIRQREWAGNPEIYKLLNRLQKLVDDYSKKDEVVSQNSRNLFNKIINELGIFNSHFLKRGVMPLENRTRGEMPQVFLSHAYDDRLYALALFEYFYGRGIYLYVDWMHHGKMDDGQELKNYLTKEMDDSIQLLFLRTINSELDIQGKQMLRSWCAWELGNFYRKDYSKDSEKYMINLYSVDNYSSSTNLQLHGLKLYSGVFSGRLEGIEITATGRGRY